jgi:PAS domain S-box-containing protein
MRQLRPDRGRAAAGRQPQNRAEARERRSTELTRTLQHIAVPSAIGDREGVITWQNDEATELVGDVRGHSFFSVVAPDDVPLARRHHERMLGGAWADYEIDILTRDGHRRRVEISAVPIEGGDRWYAIFGVALMRDSTALPSHPRLTPRQNEVLQLLGEGRSTEQIAAELHLAKETVRNHVRHVLRALGAHTRLEAVALARRRESQ